MKPMSQLEQAQVLRRLEGEQRSAQKAVQEAHTVVVAAQKREAGNRRRVAELQAEIDALAKMRTEAVVSEHAVLRWLERHHGLRIDGVIGEILADGTASAINFAVTGEIKKGERTLIVKDRVVVTIK